MFEHEYSGRASITSFMYAVYGLMAGALALTAATAFYIGTTPSIVISIFNKPSLIWIMAFAQIGLVIALSSMIQTLSLGMALAMFVLYAVSVGVTTSVVFMAFTTASIVSTFIVSAGMFGGMSVYGYLTRADLTRIGSIATMGLWGIIIAMFVNWFLQNPMVELVYSIIGVVVFTLLAAYDTQKIKQMGQQMIGSDEMLSKVAIIGALVLYLDFLNLFLMLLRFMGQRRD